MKTIAVICPDTVPLKLKETAPTTIEINNKKYSIQDKCTRATSIGIRSWKIAEILSKTPGLSVTLLIPDVNFPGKEHIDTSSIKFDIQSFDLDSASWAWSEELDRKIVKRNYNFVIIPSAMGVGFINCSVLPRSINVILDGYVPILAELPCSLLDRTNIYKRIFWNRFSEQYAALLKRANCILYANEMQLPYYEGQLFSFGRLDWKAFQFSTLLKIPYGLDVNERVKKNESTRLKLLWYGPSYPWYNPEALLEESSNLKNIDINFYATRHPRYSKNYPGCFKKYIENNSSTNVTVCEEYCDDRVSVYNEHDAGILLSRSWVEEKYSVRGRVLDMISYGIPVLLNRENPLFRELDFVEDALYPISSDTLLEDLQRINKSDMNISDESMKLIQKRMNWDTVLYPLIDYINNFSFID
ncbi:MAG TPA: hypothetical protein P5136_02255 [Methanofastidiosum sp.]|nr:hypothetical protein [Methanofastidiosum sp.]